MKKPTSLLREMIAQPGLIVAPGVADALNARIVAREGYRAIYMTGGGSSAVRLGYPDVGLMTMPEMADNAQRIAEASGLPLIADADTGYGGPLNVRRTVRSFERAGVAALHIEDQQWPKRCGHFVGKTLVPADEMTAKIRAAVDARHDQDLVIIARSDAYSVEGFERTLERGRMYREAGADVVFLEELRTREEIARTAASVGGPILYNVSISGKSPQLSNRELEKIGVKIAIFPNFLMLVTISAVQNFLRAMRDKGSVAGLTAGMATAQDRLDVLGISEVQALEKKYAVEDVVAPIGF